MASWRSCGESRKRAPEAQWRSRRNRSGRASLTMPDGRRAPRSGNAPLLQSAFCPLSSACSPRLSRRSARGRRALRLAGKQFLFHRPEEALHDRVVPHVAGTAHAARHAEFLEQPLKGLARVLDGFWSYLVPDTVGSPCAARCRSNCVITCFVNEQRDTTPRPVPALTVSYPVRPRR